MLKIDSKKLESALETKLFDKETGLNFTLLNVYSPFYERKTFWEKIKAEGVLNQPNVILGGDLNLTLTARESWGENTRQGSIALYFQKKFEKEHLVDVMPIKLEPTWRNKRGGLQAISKTMDRFLIKDSLMNENLIIKSAVETRGCSDHRPISLLISAPDKNPSAPFKFNPQCLEYEHYREQITTSWQSVQRSPNCSKMQQLADNLIRAKKITKEWNKVHKAQMQKDLKEQKRKLKLCFMRIRKGFSMKMKTYK